MILAMTDVNPDNRPTAKELLQKFTKDKNSGEQSLEERISALENENSTLKNEISVLREQLTQATSELEEYKCKASKSNN